MEQLRIGYCGPKEKWERMKWNEFVEYAAKNNVQLVWVDLTKPIEPQGPFNLIIHKMTYSMKGHDMHCNKEIEELYNYSKSHPEVRFIDDLDHVAVTLDREELNSKLSSIKWPSDMPISVPQAIMFNDEPTLENLIKITENIPFPILAKPKDASSTVQAHTLRLATSVDQLVGVRSPSLLQQYINHNGVVYKLYALGDNIIPGVRPSTRNVEPGECLNIDFFSQPSEAAKSIWTPNRDLSNVEMPIEDFQKISKVLRKELGMELIGFDILIDKDKHYWLVDLNYFPGYKNVDGLWEKFLNFMIEQINKK